VRWVGAGLAGLHRGDRVPGRGLRAPLLCTEVPGAGSGAHRGVWVWGSPRGASESRGQVPVARAVQPRGVRGAGTEFLLPGDPQGQAKQQQPSLALPSQDK
jgi:hypothetical protein